MIYFLVFLISYGCFAISDFFYSKIKSLSVSLAIFAVLLVVILSGVRDYTIGTDILVYGNSFFDMAGYTNNFMNYRQTLSAFGSSEIGYQLLNYIVHFFTVNPHILYTIIAGIINFNILYTLFLCRKIITPSLGWITYLLLIFPITLNLLRQSIALSFIAVGIALIINKKAKKSFCFFIIACLFHNSAVIGLIIWLLGVLIYKYQYNKKAISFIILSFLIFIGILSNLVTRLDLGGNKYAMYLAQSSDFAKTSIASSVMIRLPMLLLVLFIVLRNKFNLQPSSVFLYTLLIMELVMVPLQLINVTISRLMFYFGMSKILAYPLIVKKINSGLFGKVIISICIYVCYIVYLIVIFYIQIIVNNSNEIYPFIISPDLHF